MIEIPLPQLNTDIFNFGYDRNLNRSQELQGGTVYDLFRDSTQGQSISLGALLAGANNTVVVIDPSKGLWLGNTKYDDAPFKVNMNGDIKATSGILGGFTLSASQLSASGVSLQSNNLTFKKTDGTTIGSLSASDTLGLVIQTAGFAGPDIYLNGSIILVGHTAPLTDVTYDIGTSSKLIRDFWVDEVHYNTLTAISDEKTKENIKPLSNFMDKLLQLQPRTYIRKQTGVREFGFVAQEVRSVLPEVVKEATNEEEVSLGIDVMALLTLSIQAIKKLNAKVEAQQALLASYGII